MRDLDGEEWMARQLLEDLGDGPMFSSDIAVLDALGVIFEEAEAAPLTAETKAAFMARILVAGAGYEHDIENFAYELDQLDRSLPPASKIRIEAARLAGGQSTQGEILSLPPRPGLRSIATMAQENADAPEVLPETPEDHPPVIMCNQVETAGMQWGLQLDFGVAHRVRGERKLFVQPEIGIVLAWDVAKALHELIGVALAAREESDGPITLRKAFSRSS